MRIKELKEAPQIKGGQRPGEESPIPMKPGFKPNRLTPAELAQRMDDEGEKARENPFKKPYKPNRPTNLPPGVTVKETDYDDPKFNPRIERARIVNLKLELADADANRREEIAKEIYNDWSKKLISNTFNKVELENDIESCRENIENSKNEILKFEGELKKAEKKLAKLEKERDDNLSSRNNDVDKELVNTNPILLKREIDEIILQRNTSQRNADKVDVTEPSEYYNEDEHKEVCDECGGSGDLTCSSCGGQGSESCHYCGGDGYYDCDNCNNSGEVETDEQLIDEEKDLVYTLNNLDLIFDENDLVNENVYKSRVLQQPYIRQTQWQGENTIEDIEYEYGLMNLDLSKGSISIYWGEKSI